MSIVNDIALTRFCSKSKDYIDNFYKNSTVITFTSNLSVTTTNAAWRIKYTTSSNNAIATCNNGLITIQKTGTYLISAKLGLSVGGNGTCYIRHRLYTNASIPSNTNLITGTNVFTASTYAYGYPNAAQGQPIFDLLYLTEGTVIGFAAEKTLSGTSTVQHFPSNTSVSLFRVSSNNLLE